MSVPTSDKEATDFGFDLGSKTSSKQDNIIDNQLGEVLSVLAALNFNIQGTIDAAVDHGSIILLIDLQTQDFMNSNAAGLDVKTGATPMPAPCNGSTDTVCRHHLDDTGTFSIAPDSPMNAPVVGEIADGTFSGGPGDVTLQLAISSTTPIQLNLLHALVEARSLSDTGIMIAKVGGLVSHEALMTQIGPAIQAQIADVVGRDCPVAARGTRTPPGCGCTVGTSGATAIAALDGKASGSVADCQITVKELLGFPPVASLLIPNSCSMDTCKASDSLSIGVQVQAVKATFPM